MGYDKNKHLVTVVVGAAEDGDKPHWCWWVRAAGWGLLEVWPGSDVKTFVLDGEFWGRRRIVRELSTRGPLTDSSCELTDLLVGGLAFLELLADLLVRVDDG